MHIAVLSSANSWYLEDLIRAAGAEHTIELVGYRELATEVQVVDGPSSQDVAWETRFAFRSGPHNLAGIDALLVRSMPPGTLEQVIFRMNALAGLAAEGVQIVNPPRAIEIAVDKYLATTRLASAGLLVPQTFTCQTSGQAMEGFVQLGGDVVVKPVFGSEGRGITRVTDEAIAHRTFKALEQIGAVIYLQRFVKHEGADLRLMVIGDRVLGMRRRHPSDWRTNISRGATAEPLEVTPQLAEIAIRCVGAVEAEIAGVDLLPGKDGEIYALEVNAVPGWRALSQVTGTDVASLVLRHLSSK